MKDCFVVLDSTYAHGGTDLAHLNTLTDGGIGIYNAIAGTLVSSAPDLTDDEIIVCMGRTLGGVQKSIPISRKDVSYTAPITATGATFKTTGLGNDSSGLYSHLTYPTAIASGMFVGVIIEDLEKHPLDNTRQRRYVYDLLPTDTLDTSITALTAIINADQFRLVDAVADLTNDAIALTGITAGHNYKAVLIGEYVGSDIIEADSVNGAYTSAEAVQTSISDGVGTAEQIREFELEALAESGQTNTYRPIQGLNGLTPRAVTGTLYNIYTLQFTNERKNGERTNVPPDNQIVRICVPNDTAYNTENAIFANVCPGL